jgi:hypothetical protein
MLSRIRSDMLSRGLRRLSRTLERRLVRSPHFVVANLIGRRNAHRANMVQLECTALQRLPAGRTTDYDEATG